MDDGIMLFFYTEILLMMRCRYRKWGEEEIFAFFICILQLYLSSLCTKIHTNVEGYILHKWL